MSLPSFDTNKIMANVSKTNRILISVAAIIGAITVIGGGYSYYVNNFYIPTIKVISIDFAKGVAKVQHRKKVIDIYFFLFIMNKTNINRIIGIKCIV